MNRIPSFICFWILLTFIHYSFSQTHRINCGGNAYTDSLGRNWAADNFYFGGTASSSEQTAIAGTNDPTIYRRYRWQSGSLRYSLPINGRAYFNVTLHFVDGWSGTQGVGLRVFHIFLEGTKVVDSFDIYATGGGYAAVTQSFTVLGCGNAFDVVLQAIVQNPAIAGIEIVQLPQQAPDDCPSGPAPPTAPTTPKYDYSELLHKTWIYYEAQRSGDLTNEPVRRLAWRGNSFGDVKNVAGRDLSGGNMESSNRMKFGLPLAATWTLLAWGGIEYRQGYERTGELFYLIDGIKRTAKYFFECHRSPFEFYGQVGTTNFDFGYCGPPEEFDRSRPVHLLTPTKPASEIVGETSAALSSGSIVVRWNDSAFADQMLNSARQLYIFAKTYQGSSRTSIPNHEVYYPSSGYVDELAWAAIWLYKATGEIEYLNDAIAFHQECCLYYPGWGFSWGEKHTGINVLLAKATGNPIYINLANGYFDKWLPGENREIPHTPLGLAFREDWGPLRYAANTAFLAMVFADYIRILDYNDPINKTYVPGTRSWHLFNYAVSQINYITGDGGRSYVVGFGPNPPTRFYHEMSQNPTIDWPTRGNTGACKSDHRNNPGPQRMHLWGAVMGGPTINDQYQDNGNSWVRSEPTQDYSAALAGAAAKLADYYSMGPFCGAVDFNWGHPNASLGFTPRGLKQSLPACQPGWTYVEPPYTPPVRPEIENCSCVAFRLDDVQDWFVFEGQKAVLDLFREDRTPITVGVIGNSFGLDRRIIQYIRDIAVGDTTWEVEIASHGLNHEDFSLYNPEDQYELLRQSKLKIEEQLGLFPGSVTTFIPPYNAWNQFTLEALKNNNFTVFSSQKELDPPPYKLSNMSVYHIPIGAATNDLAINEYFVGVPWQKTMDDIRAQLASNGFAAVMMHPQEFSERDPVTGQYQPRVNQTQLVQLALLLQAVKDAGLRIVPLGKVPLDVNQTALITPPGPGYSPPIDTPVKYINCTAFRLDNVQDYYLRQTTIAVLEVFKNAGAPITTGIIGNFFGDDITLLNYLRNSTYDPNWEIEFANKGWNLVSYAPLFVEQQTQLIGQTNNLIYNTLQVHPVTFIPPFDEFVGGTLTAIQINDMSVISAYTQVDLPPYDYESPPVWRFPSGPSTFDRNYPLTVLDFNVTLNRTQEDISTIGFSVVVMTPEDFSLRDGEGLPNDIPNVAKLNELSLLLSRIRQNNWDIVSVANLRNRFNDSVPVYNPVVIPPPPTPPPTPAPTPAPTTPPPSCNCIAFRFDQIQDGYLSAATSAILDYFEQENLTITVGVIGGFFGFDSQLIQKLDQPNVEIANSGWVFEDFEAIQNLEEQRTLIGNTVDKIQTTFNRATRVFIPPYGNFNQNTLQAVAQLGIYVFSSFTSLDSRKNTLESSTWHFPAGAYTGKFVPGVGITGASTVEIFSSITTQFQTHGFAVVSMSPQEFSQHSNGVYIDAVNQTMMNELQILISALRSLNYEFISLEQMPFKFGAVITPPPNTYTPTSSEESQSPSSHSSDSSKSNLPLLIGVVCAGVGFVVMLVICILLCKKHNKKLRNKILDRKFTEMDMEGIEMKFPPRDVNQPSPASGKIKESNQQSEYQQPTPLKKPTYAPPPSPNVKFTEPTPTVRFAEPSPSNNHSPISSAPPPRPNRPPVPSRPSPPSQGSLREYDNDMVSYAIAQEFKRKQTQKQQPN